MGQLKTGPTWVHMMTAHGEDRPRCYKRYEAADQTYQMTEPMQEIRDWVATRIWFGLVFAAAHRHCKELCEHQTLPVVV